MVSYPLRWLSGSIFLLNLVTPLPIQAQIVRDTTLPNPSVVTPKGNINVITGGTQTGVNLFHSFKQFSVPTNGEVFFNNTQDILNIFSRVTGSSDSKIYGTLRANGTANLFLLNPNRIIFGPNAQLDIGGSFLASTASSLKFSDSSEFSATNPNSPLLLLTVNVLLGLQFASTPGSIVSKAQAFDDDGFVTSLAVKPGKTLTLVGGEINLVGGALGARDGRIELGSVASPGFVGLTPTDIGFALDYSGIQNFQDIGLLQSALVDVSGDAGGDVTITARKLQVQDGSQIISAAYSKGVGGTLRVNATDAIELIGTHISNSDKYESGFVSAVMGNAGGTGTNLILSTRQLTIRDGARLSSNTDGQGRGGDQIVTASDAIELSGTDIFEDASGIFTSTLGSGDAGNITITTQRLTTQQGAQISSITKGSGQGGNLTVTASDFLTALGTSLSDSEISNIQKNDVEAIKNSGLLTQTQFPNEQAPRSGYGNAGRLKIETEQLRVLDGAQISSTTFTDGRAGDMLVQAPIIELAGIALSADGQVILETRDSRPIGSGLFASADEKSTGSGATLTVKAQELSLSDGAVIQTSTLSSGDAGNLEVTASTIEVIGTAQGGRYPTTIQALSGGIPRFPGVVKATGRGGNLRIDTKALLVQDGAAVAVGSLNKTNEARGAGNLDIQAQIVRLNNQGELTAATESGNGGNITVQAQDLLLLSNNSNISTNAGIAGTTGQGGNITVMETGNLVAIDNSDITANATQDRGGEVNITAQSIFGTAAREQQTLASDITASSDLGPQFSGTVQINTPDIDPSQGIANLPSEPINTEIAQDCQAGSGRATSQFINSGSGGLPTNPYEPLDSRDILADVQAPSQWADTVDTGTRGFEDTKRGSKGESPTRFNRDTGTASFQRRILSRQNSPSAQVASPNQIVEAQGWSINDMGELVLYQVPHRLSQKGCRLR